MYLHSGKRRLPRRQPVETRLLYANLVSSQIPPNKAMRNRPPSWVGQSGFLSYVDSEIWDESTGLRGEWTYFVADCLQAQLKKLSGQREDKFLLWDAN